MHVAIARVLFFTAFSGWGLLQYNLKLHESKFYLKQIIELRSSKHTFFVVANNTVFLFYDYIESVNLVFIFLLYIFWVFLNSVPLLKNLPTDKLARIADCLEVVGITRTLNFCANQRSYEIVFTISRLSRLYITIVCLSFKRHHARFMLMDLFVINIIHVYQFSEINKWSYTSKW